MEMYLTTTSCRRKQLLTHFDKNAQSLLYGTEKCCDNCRGKPIGNYEFTQSNIGARKADFAEFANVVLGAIEDNE